jgi:hypothetical protein
MARLHFEMHHVSTTERDVEYVNLAVDGAKSGANNLAITVSTECVTTEGRSGCVWRRPVVIAL